MFNKLFFGKTFVRHLRNKLWRSSMCLVGYLFIAFPSPQIANLRLFSPFSMVNDLFSWIIQSLLIYLRRSFTFYYSSLSTSDLSMNFFILFSNEFFSRSEGFFWWLRGLSAFFVLLLSIERLVAFSYSNTDFDDVPFGGEQFTYLWKFGT